MLLLSGKHRYEAIHERGSHIDFPDLIWTLGAIRDTALLTEKHTNQQIAKLMAEHRPCGQRWQGGEWGECFQNAKSISVSERISGQGTQTLFVRFPED